MSDHPLRLTQTRSRILEILADHCYITTGQCARILGIERGYPLRALQMVLRRAYLGGLLNRRKVVDYDDSRGFTPYELAYWLTKQGCERIGRGKFNEEKSPRTLEHEIAISEFHIRLAKACKERGVALHWRQRNLKRTVNPDALFGLSDPGLPANENTFYYFLEVEKSKQGNYRQGESGLIRKLNRYHEYQAGGHCREDWRWFDQFRVVVVVKNEARRRNLLLALEETQPTRIFWVTTGDAELSQKVFLTPKDHGQTAYSLLG